MRCEGCLRYRCVKGGIRTGTRTCVWPQYTNRPCSQTAKVQSQGGGGGGRRGTNHAWMCVSKSEGYGSLLRFK